MLGDWIGFILGCIIVGTAICGWIVGMIINSKYPPDDNTRAY